MKRHVVVLLVLLAATTAATTVYGQGGFPPEMAGDQLRLGPVCYFTTMVYTGAYNLPWSTPDPTGVVRQVEVFSGPDEFGLTDLFLGRRYELTWVPDCGCYATWTFPAPDKIRFLSVTVTLFEDAWTAVMREGQLMFTGHPPQFWEFDPGYPMLTAQINPWPVVEPGRGEIPESFYE